MVEAFATPLADGSMAGYAWGEPLPSGGLGWAIVAVLTVLGVIVVVGALLLGLHTTRRVLDIRELRRQHWPNGLLPADYLQATPHVPLSGEDLPYLLAVLGKSKRTRAENRYVDTVLGEQRDEWIPALTRQGAFMVSLSAPDQGNALVAKVLGVSTDIPDQSQALIFYVRDDGTRVCAVFPEARDTWAVTYTDFAERVDEWCRVLDSDVEVRHPRSGVIELLWDVCAPPVRRSTETPGRYIEVDGLEPEDAVTDIGEPDENGYTPTSHKRLPEIR